MQKILIVLNNIVNLVFSIGSVIEEENDLKNTPSGKTIKVSFVLAAFSVRIKVRHQIYNAN